jgi:hypothetical protein
MSLIPGIEGARILRIAAFLALFSVFCPACRHGEVGVSEPSAGPAYLTGEEPGDELIVEKVVEGPQKVIEIPIPPNPYEDQPADCACCCKEACAGGVGSAEFDLFVIALKQEATMKIQAAADALLASGGDLVKFEGWQEIVKDCMDILGSPTLVVVQLSSGKWKKVKFEELATLDEDVREIALIKASVGEKMKAALAANMVGRGVAEADAKAIAGKIIKTYMDKIAP